MQTLILIIKAIPILKEWFDKLWYLYLEAEYHSLLIKNREGIKKLVDEYDQRQVENAIGSTKEGLPSGLPDSVIIDHAPPGVSNERKD